MTEPGAHGYSDKHLIHKCFAPTLYTNAISMSTIRLPPHPIQVIDHDKTVTFTFAGETITAQAGDTIASALYAAGGRIFSRSF